MPAALKVKAETSMSSATVVVVVPHVTGLVPPDPPLVVSGAACDSPLISNIPIPKNVVPPLAGVNVRVPEVVEGLRARHT